MDNRDFSKSQQVFCIFMINGIHCIGVNESCAKTRKQTAHLQTALLHCIVQCGPRYEPLSGAPFNPRRHLRSGNSPLVELIHCRSDLFKSIFTARLARKSTITVVYSQALSGGAHRALHNARFFTDMVRIKGFAPGKHGPQDARIFVGQRHHRFLPA